jgi:predicted metal-dependent peptidase
MAPKRPPRKAARQDPALEAVAKGWALIVAHPLFGPLAERAYFSRVEGNGCPKDGWAIVHSDGEIAIHPTRKADPQVWVWVFAHCLLHLGFGHVRKSVLDESELDLAFNSACCCTVNRLLGSLKVGLSPIPIPSELPSGEEAAIAETFRRDGVPAELVSCGTSGSGGDLAYRSANYWSPPQWEQRLAQGLRAAVAAAVSVAGGEFADLTGRPGRTSGWQRALNWFIASYPLLGAIASSFKLVEDAAICDRMEIRVAAISPAAQEIYAHPLAGMSEAECRFVMAHELLHAGLRHDVRSGGRDHYLFNIASDFVINGWLVEMEVGELPEGLLYDPELKGLSSEEVYDRIATDLRRYRKLATSRGVALTDVLPGRLPEADEAAEAVDLDEFYRRCLAQGLEYHQSSGRGLLPEGLVEEIRALSQPPIEWEVELARWFDDFFPALERRLTYARPSRRQASTPDIPRPSYVLPEELHSRRTFAVVLDTSGSMERVLLGKALGAIASYALSRDVPAVRVVFCDAAAYDAGYLEPTEIAGKVRVKGRGGTVLQPGIDLIESAPDFPRNGPILVITDAQCDRVKIRREHAFLVPKGALLPFPPRGPVFRLS